MDVSSTVPDLTPGEIRRALAGLPHAEGYDLCVIPLRYRGDKPHLSAWTDFDERTITIQMPEPFLPFGEVIPYGAQRRPGKGMRFIWLTEGITFRAWDRTSGTAGTTTDTADNGGATPFSTATETASIVVNAVNLDWEDLPLAGLLHSRYGLPVTVLNDSQAAAIGEYVYGGEHNPDGNLVVVNVRHGIGAGILINGRLFQGDGGGAGEIGHVVVQENGALCRCGKRGCLETVASAQAVLDRVRSQIGMAQMDTLEEVQAAFESGNTLVKQVVLDAGHMLGVSLANLIGTLNIQKIVLTGDMTRFGKPWLESVNQAMQDAALGRMAEGTELEVGKLDYRGCILGASALLLLNSYSLLFTGVEEN